MASKRNKKQRQQCYTKRISAKYEGLVVASITDRIHKLKEYLDAEEIPLALYCQCIDEITLIKQFIRDYNIKLPVDVNMKLLEY